METFKIGILEPDNFSPKAIEKLEGIGIVSRYEGIGTREDIRCFIADKDALFVRLSYQIDQDLISGAQRLKYICSPTTGLNHISIGDKDIKIVSLKGEYEFLNTIRATPEHVFGLTLALLRNYKEAFIKSHEQLFDRDVYRGYELYGAKIGIIGLGRIGRLLTKYFTAFDAHVGYYDVLEKGEVINGVVRYNTIEELILESEIVILEANYTLENDKMITADLLHMMRGKFFINAARGELVDEIELLEEIKNNVFKGVAIDTFTNEANAENHVKEFIDLTEGRNLIVTPHIGGATYTSMQRTEEFVTNLLIKSFRKKTF